MVTSYGFMSGYKRGMTSDVEEARGSAFTTLGFHIGAGERKNKAGRAMLPPPQGHC